jgi:hypothetical protein
MVKMDFRFRGNDSKKLMSPCTLVAGSNNKVRFCDYAQNDKIIMSVIPDKCKILFFSQPAPECLNRVVIHFLHAVALRAVAGSIEQNNKGRILRLRAE